MSIPFSHVLICRTDNIGDVVLTLPLAGFLKREYPGVRIDFLCRAYAAPVVRQCRFVDQVIALETLADRQAYFAASGVDTVIFAYPDRRLAQAAKRPASATGSAPVTGCIIFFTAISWPISAGSTRLCTRRN